MAGKDLNLIHVKRLSDAIATPIARYQRHVGAAADRQTTHNILDAIAWTLATLIARLPRNDYRQARDYFMSRFEESVTVVRAAPARQFDPTEYPLDE
jgi:hypothetical protein